MTFTVGATTTLHCYDRNGNMTRRDPSGATVYNFQYDAESRPSGYALRTRLTAVSGSATASFVFDGDGNRVKSTAGGVTTVEPGSLLRVDGQHEHDEDILQRWRSAGGGAQRV